MPTTTTCPDCGHDTTHSPLSGCLWADGDAYCTCTAAWTKPKTLSDARAERDSAMAQVAEHTDADWEAAAVEAVRTLAARRFGPDDDPKRYPDPFTSDDVWDLLAERGAPQCREPRALGPIVQAAVRQGLIVATGYAPSRRRHATPIRVYVGTDL